MREEPGQDQNQASCVTERQEQCPLWKKRAYGDRETFGDRQPCRAKFVVPAIRRMPKAQAATAGPIEESPHSGTSAAARMRTLSGAILVFNIRGNAKAVTYHVAFCLTSLVHKKHTKYPHSTQMLADIFLLTWVIIIAH